MGWKQLVLITVFVVIFIYALKWLVSKYNVPLVSDVVKTV